MEFDNSWYVIERKNRYEVVAHRELSSMDEGTYLLLENYATHHEALMELKRLIMLEIQDTKANLDRFDVHARRK